MPIFARIALVLMTASVAAAPALAQNNSPDKRRLAVTDPAEADADFVLQGEYQGMTYTPTLGCEPAGLQVVAAEDGQFQAVQYQGGLPGAGFNLNDKFALAGASRAGVLALGAGDDRYTVTIQGEVATLRNSAGQVVGHLAKVLRVSTTLGACPPECATVLFDGTGTDHFTGARMTEDGLLMEGPVTRDPVGDFYLHLEFRTPYMPLPADKAAATAASTSSGGTSCRCWIRSACRACIMNAEDCTRRARRT